MLRLGVHPVEDMARAADAIAQGDLSRRVEHPGGNTEFGRLVELSLRSSGELARPHGVRAERQGQVCPLRAPGSAAFGGRRS